MYKENESKKENETKQEDVIKQENPQDKLVVKQAEIIATQAEAIQLDNSKKPRSKAFIILLVLFIISIIAAGIVYIYGVSYYSSHFFPLTSVDSFDISNLDLDTAIQNIEKKYMEYEFDILDQDNIMGAIIYASDLEIKLDTKDELENLLAGQNSFQWILQWTNDKEYNLSYNAEFDVSKLEEIMSEWEFLKEEKMTMPTDAYISNYSSEIKGYTIIPETKGSYIEYDKAKEVIIDCIEKWLSKINLDECYIRANITENDELLVAELEQRNTITKTEIVYDWNGNQVVLDGDTIHEWILNENNNIVIDEEKVSEFVKEQASQYDTYGKKREFKTYFGEYLTLSSGAYGWKTDKTEETAELIQLIYEGTVAEREPCYTNKGYVKGLNDIGNSYVEIDLTKQHLYVYIDGSVVLETDLVSGSLKGTGTVTPPGVFGLTYKTTNAVLRGDDYETPVKYWMPFNGNIGMHDATWRRTFGGEIYKTSGSHGCINLPLAKAAEIYNYVSTGFPVICYYFEQVIIPEEPSSEVIDETTGEVIGETVGGIMDETAGAGITEPGVEAVNETVVETVEGL